jgi:SAM-dependent methyltransferase
MSYFDYFAKSRSTKIGGYLHGKKTTNEFKYILNILNNKSYSMEILEIGPGKGDLAKLFLKCKFNNYDIVEPNDLMRNKLKQKGIRKGKNYMIPYLNEKNDSYDLIIISNVFEHLNDTSEAKIFISEVRRVLKKGGYIFILSPDILDWGLDFWNCDFSHSNPTSIRRTIQLFLNNNLKVISYKYTYSCFEGLLGYIINRIIKLFTFLAKGNYLNSKLYKLKLTFSRRFLIIGQK